MAYSTEIDPFSLHITYLKPESVPFDGSKAGPPGSSAVEEPSPWQQAELGLTVQKEK